MIDKSLKQGLLKLLKKQGKPKKHHTMNKDIKISLIKKTLAILFFMLYSFILLGIIGILTKANDPNTSQAGWVTILIIALLAFGGYLSYKIKFYKP